MGLSHYSMIIPLILEIVPIGISTIIPLSHYIVIYPLI